MATKETLKPYPLNKKLTPRQKSWVTHFCDCQDKTEASRRCMYSEKSASQMGYENGIRLERFVEREMTRRYEKGMIQRTKYTQHELLEMAEKDLRNTDGMIRAQARKFIAQVQKQERDWQLKKEEIRVRELEAQANSGGSDGSQETVFRIEVVDNEHS